MKTVIVRSDDGLRRYLKRKRCKVDLSKVYRDIFIDGCFIFKNRHILYDPGYEIESGKFKEVK